MKLIDKRFRCEDVGLSLRLPAPQAPMSAQVGAFCYEDNLFLQNETLGRIYYDGPEPEPQAPRALQCKWFED